MYRVSLGITRTGRDVDHPPPSTAEVEERVELYIYSSFRPSWPVVVRMLYCNVPNKNKWIIVTGDCAVKWSAASVRDYSEPSSYDRIDIRTTWVTTKILVLTYDQSLELRMPVKAKTCGCKQRPEMRS